MKASRMNCSKCGDVLTLENRVPNLNQCKPCRANYQAKYVATHHAQFQEQRRLNPYRDWARKALSNHKHGFTIQMSVCDLEETARKTSHCQICSALLVWVNRTHRNLSSATLDRIDNGVVINVATIQIVCKACNISKSNRTMKEFIDYCKMVSTKFAKLLEVS